MRDINALETGNRERERERARENTWYNRLHMSVIANRCYFVDGTVRLIGLHNFTICIHIKCTSKQKSTSHLNTYKMFRQTKWLPFKSNVFYGANMRKNRTSNRFLMLNITIELLQSGNNTINTGLMW